jgi:hypothetical protein
MLNLIDEYKKQLKEQIVSFYKNHGNMVARMIEICKEIKTCSDRSIFLKLQQEYRDFLSLCRHFNNTELYLYCPPPLDSPIYKWHKQVVERWLRYWCVEIYLGSEKSRKRLKQYVEIHYEHDFPHKVCIDFTGTITKHHKWRQELGLEHLDAIILHT